MGKDRDFWVRFRGVDGMFAHTGYVMRLAVGGPVAGSNDHVHLEIAEGVYPGAGRTLAIALPMEEARRLRDVLNERIPD